jgi:hypothetical protein
MTTKMIDDVKYGYGVLCAVEALTAKGRFNHILFAFDILANLLDVVKIVVMDRVKFNAQER